MILIKISQKKRKENGRVNLLVHAYDANHAYAYNFNWLSANSKTVKSTQVRHL